jgi:hypothetical protein
MHLLITKLGSSGPSQGTKPARTSLLTTSTDQMPNGLSQCTFEFPTNTVDPGLCLRRWGHRGPWGYGAMGRRACKLPSRRRFGICLLGPHRLKKESSYWQTPDRSDGSSPSKAVVSFRQKFRRPVFILITIPVCTIEE